MVHLDESSGILGLLLVARGSSRVRVRWYLSVTRGNHASCGKGRAGVVNIAGLWIELGSREPQAPLRAQGAGWLKLLRSQGLVAVSESRIVQPKTFAFELGSRLAELRAVWHDKPADSAALGGQGFGRGRVAGEPSERVIGVLSSGHGHRRGPNRGIAGGLQQACLDYCRVPSLPRRLLQGNFPGVKSSSRTGYVSGGVSE